ncbi:conserved hypothetical protein [Segniliparus rotundus DSM 44985]|uniref:ABC transporter domain-containing protein n=1 Tax=Segniliparus rotundus (strain ATCC BAA-972 / CDC 1076 / CIP 108378 / DSM 44985 / JCM 13578) TaxID=640132 RepID=D6ZB31_SEGRD|nr:hypothetical protein [Segniliparus rotundus]ADG96790.1 conserved hypothetical protein [Segniliparus rotundus DSM 44985]
MDLQDERARAAPVIIADGLGVDGEHGPFFSDIRLALAPGLHAVRTSGPPAQSVLLLTLAGRFKPSRGELSVRGDVEPGKIRRHCAIAAFADIDELEEAVTVRTVLAEQRRWLAPWCSRAKAEPAAAVLGEVFAEIPPPPLAKYVADLSDLEVFLLRIALALVTDRPILVVGDLEQVRDSAHRALAARRLGALAARRTVVVGVANPLGDDAPDHTLHDCRILLRKD